MVKPGQVAAEIHAPALEPLGKVLRFWYQTEDFKALIQGDLVIFPFHSFTAK